MKISVLMLLMATLAIYADLGRLAFRRRVQD
jgi:hypothetical protein